MTYPRQQSGQTATVKVFLVEDSPILRERVEAILTSIPGAQACGHAASAAGAIAAIEAAKPDAVVLDIQLEQGSGFEVMRAIRASMPQVQFYVLTNFANDAYRRKAENLGARGFFDKSSEFEHLRKALTQLSS